MALRKIIDGVGRRLGVKAPKPVKLSEVLVRRQRLLAAYEIDFILDVGANEGQFARQMRQLGYQRRIVSFEPLQSAFDLLRANAARDKDWQILHYGLGEKSERRSINVAANSFSSSLLDMLPAHETAAPESRYIAREQVDIRRLDEVFPSLNAMGQKIYLKIDTQGFELPVLRGAEQSMQYIDTLQLELSLVQLYQNEPLYDEICAWLASKSYELVSIEPGFSDPATGRLLQFDGIFHRYSA